MDELSKKYHGYAPRDESFLTSLTYEELLDVARVRGHVLDELYNEIGLLETRLAR